MFNIVGPPSHVFMKRENHRRARDIGSDARITHVTKLIHNWTRVRPVGTAALHGGGCVVRVCACVLDNPQCDNKNINRLFGMRLPGSSSTRVKCV